MTGVAAPEGQTKSFVYRAFDAHGELLYVGCTWLPELRYSQHRKSSVWFQYATRFTMTGPHDRTAALAHERRAIETEEPWFNVLSVDRGWVHRRNRADSRLTGGWSRRWSGLELSDRIWDEADGEVPAYDNDWRHAAYLNATLYRDAAA